MEKTKESTKADDPMTRDLGSSMTPYSLDTQLSAETTTAKTRVDLLINSWMQRTNSVDGISFLVMAKEMGTETAVFWAERLGLKYHNAFAQLKAGEASR